MSVKGIAVFTIVDLRDIYTNSIAPENPALDMLWLDTSVVPNALKRWNGSSWVKTGASSLDELDPEASETIIMHTSQITNTATALGFNLETLTLVNSGVNKRLTDTESYIQMYDNKIKTSVSQADITTSINGLVIGAENLLQNSGKFTSLANWHCDNSIDANVSIETQFIKITRVAGSSELAIYNDSLNKVLFDISKKYIATFKIKCTGTVVVKYAIQSKDGTQVVVPKTTVDNLNNEEKTVSLDFTPSMTAWTDMNLFIYLSSININTSFCIETIKIEKGTKATDWSPSGLELKTSTENNIDTMYSINNRLKVAEQVITPDSIISTVMDSSNFTDYKNDVQNDFTVLDQIVSSHTSSITQLSDSITSKVSQSDIDASINNISVGVKNLVGKFNAKTTISTIATGISGFGYTLDVNENITKEFGALILKKNTTYIVSFIAWCAAGIQPLIMDINPDDIMTDYSVTLGTTANTYIYKFTTSNTDSVSNCNMRFWNYTQTRTSKVYITDIVLTEGTKAPTNYLVPPEDITNRISSAESSITQLSTSITSKVDVDGVKSTITQSASEVQTAFNSATGTFIVKNGKFELRKDNDTKVMWVGTGGNLTCNKLDVIGTGDQTVHFSGTGTKAVVIESESGGTCKVSFQSNNYGYKSMAEILSYTDAQPIGCLFIQPRDYLVARSAKSDAQINRAINASIYGDLNICGADYPADDVDGNDAGYSGHTNGHLNVYGNLYVVGTKSRIVKVKSGAVYGMNAVESPDCLFIIRGKGKLIDGQCAIQFDEKWLQVVNTDIEYTVYPAPYGEGYVWPDASTMTKTGFIMKGNNDIEFGYIVYAKQIGYEDVYMQKVMLDDKLYKTL